MIRGSRCTDPLSRRGPTTYGGLVPRSLAVVFCAAADGG